MSSNVLKIQEGKSYYWQVLGNGSDSSLHIYNSAGLEFASIEKTDNDFAERGDKYFLNLLRNDYSGPNLAGQVSKLFTEDAKKLLFKKNGNRDSI